MNKFLPKFKMGNNKKYKIKVIQNIAIYIKKKDRYLPGLYYLVKWKGHLEEKNM